MAMTAGSVVISSSGVATKSGLAEAIYDEFVDNFLGDTGMPMPAGADGKPIKDGYATLATNMAVALVTYMQANAEAEIGAGVAALQKTPNPNNPDTATKAPGVAKYLPIV